MWLVLMKQEGYEIRPILKKAKRSTHIPQWEFCPLDRDSKLW